MSKINKILKPILFVFVLILLIFSTYRFCIANFLIAHALGENNGVFYTNSKEAFINSYKKGFRQFEVDLTKTTDNKVVCFHAFNQKIYENLHIKQNNYTHDEFMSGKVFSAPEYKFTPIDLEQFVSLMKTHKNIKVMMHLHSEKNPQTTQFLLNEIIKTVGDDKQIYNRIYIGINFPEEIPILTGQNKIKNIMYYIDVKNKRPENMKKIDDIIAFMKKHNIHVVSMPYKAIIKYPKEVKKLRKNNIYIYSFAQNEIKEIIKMKIIGVNAIGTDTIFEW